MSSNTKQINAKITEHVVSGTSCRLVMHAPELAVIANPGQFMHVLCGSSYDPLLRRPLSIYYAEPETGKLAVLYEIRGRGTALLAEKKPGDTVDIIGPLGNGFKLPDTADYRAILVGGGIGSPPLYFLAVRMGAPAALEQMEFHIGARTYGKHVCLDDFRRLCDGHVSSERLCVATDDGSYGHHGFVTDTLRNCLSLRSEPMPLIYACGPIPMLKAVAGIAKDHGAKCQVSLEAKMACGVGACMGCVIKVRDGDGSKYVRVCHEGPVFDAAEVIWDE